MSSESSGRDSMNKLAKILLSVLGGINTTFHIFTPIMLAAVMSSMGFLNMFQINFMFVLGFLSTLFRAIRVGWMK
jgi:hypothetical protein